MKRVTNVTGSSDKRKPAWRLLQPLWDESPTKWRSNVVVEEDCPFWATTAPHSSHSAHPAAA